MVIVITTGLLGIPFARKLEENAIEFRAKEALRVRKYKTKTSCQTTLTHGSTTRKLSVRDALLVAVGPAILRSPRIIRRLILPQTAAVICTTTMRPLSSRVPYTALVNLSPMVRKCCRNGLSDGERAPPFRVVLPINFLVSVSSRCQRIVLVKN
jgi:hypothetical protein